MLDCPVCPTKNITEETCPQCGTDLGPLIRVGELPKLYFQDALQLLEEGDTTDVVQQLNVVVSMRPDFTEAHLRLAEVYTGRGWFEAAIEQLDRAAELDPGRNEIFELRKAAERKVAEQRLKTEKQKAAVGRLRRMVALLPPTTAVVTRLV